MWTTQRHAVANVPFNRLIRKSGKKLDNRKETWIPMQTIAHSALTILSGLP